ncbi:MAG: zinc ribbon domain-containing protein [bacterium]
MLALALGTLLAVGALAYVLFPLLFGTTTLRPMRTIISARTAKGAEDDAVVALREIEFDRVTGKLSDADYAELKTRYTGRALAAMRTGVADPAQALDAAEAAVLAYRARMKSCARCGPRPEPDAGYCSSCGTYLPGKCEGCGASVDETGAAFCSHCGRQLAA